MLGFVLLPPQVGCLLTPLLGLLFVSFFFYFAGRAAGLWLWKLPIKYKNVCEWPLATATSGSNVEEPHRIDGEFMKRRAHFCCGTQFGIYLHNNWQAESIQNALG